MFTHTRDLQNFLAISDNHYLSTMPEENDPKDQSFFDYTRQYILQDKKISRQTRDNRLAYISGFRKYKSHVCFKDLDANLLNGFRAYLIANLSRSEKTVNKMFAFFKQVLSAAVKDGYLDKKSMEEFKDSRS